MNKIYISEAMGCVFYLEHDTVMAAPMSTDDTVSFEESCQVEEWSDCDMTEAQIRAKLA
jgi:hypothetical protein